MTPERWQKVEEVLQGALDRPPQDRTSFLDEACAGDDQLKKEAASLINAHDEAGDFIEPLEDASSIFVARIHPETTAREGRPLRLVVDTRRLHFFEPESGRAIHG